MSMDDEHPSEDLEWENRLLCSDENCIGTIGPDGRCRECGKPYAGELPPGFGTVRPRQSGAAGPEEPAPAVNAAEGSACADDPEPDDEEAGPAAGEDEWEQRRLCSDESCTGTIGPDGRCRECGKPAAE